MLPQIGQIGLDPSTSRLVSRLLARSPPSSLQSALAASTWIAENVRLLENAMGGLDAFDSDNLDRVLLSQFLYPRLLIYLISCAYVQTPSLLPVIRQKQIEWATMDPPIQLSAHRSIQDSIWEFFTQCTDYTITMRTTGEQIAKTDVFCICAHVLVVLGDQDRIGKFKIEHHQYLGNFIDLLQLLVDSPELKLCWPLLVRIMRGLSRGSDVFPSSLNLSGVEPNTERHIGSGTFGEVWGGTVGNVRVAVKVIRHHVEGRPVPERFFTEAFIKEALLWKQLRNPHVLPFYGVSRLPQDSRAISLISPLMPHGNILDYSVKLPVSERLPLLADAASGLEYLHTLELPVIHGNIKVENILVTQYGRACLADFGLCTLIEDPVFHYTAASAIPGTVNQCLPESYEIGQQVMKKTFSSDIFALGCVCYELCMNKTTRFSHLGLLQRYHGVGKNWRMVQPTSMSPRLWNMVETCWEIQPSARPTITEVVKTLKGEVLQTEFMEMVPNRWDLGISTYLRGPVLISPLLDRPRLEPNVEPIVKIGQDVIIALMGPTGTGKSSFVNIAFQEAAAGVSDSLESCTQEVRAFACWHPDRSGRRIILVDTPGFDDTYKTDWDILKTISHWLAETYRQKITLSGILQFHAIDERKMRGTPQRNLVMFEDLCGKGAMHNVVFVSTFWDRTPETTATDREHQLKTQFWTPMIEKGAKVERFSPRTYDKAWEIIDRFSCAKTAPLTVQKEMVDEGKLLQETSAFLSLKRFTSSFLSSFSRAF